MKQIIEGTAVFLDIRNFTDNLKKLFNDDLYFELIESVYRKGIELGLEFASKDRFYINTTGDGFLAIFLEENSCIDAYFYSLLLHNELNKIFSEYFKGELQKGDYYFGIGLESGLIKNVKAEYGDKEINTFIGNVINVAARLESLTKDHARAPIIFGPNINEKLINMLFKESYSNLMEQAKRADSTERAHLLHEKMTELNSRLLSSYLFEHRLKGVDTATPVFRISPTLLNYSKNHFKDLISILPTEQRDKILGIIEKYK